MTVCVEYNPKSWWPFLELPPGLKLKPRTGWTSCENNHTHAFFFSKKISSRTSLTFVLRILWPLCSGGQTAFQCQAPLVCMLQCPWAQVSVSYQFHILLTFPGFQAPNNSLPGSFSVRILDRNAKVWLESSWSDAKQDKPFLALTLIIIMPVAVKYELNMMASM